MKETTRAETGMAYRYLLVILSSNQGAALKSQVIVSKEVRIGIVKKNTCRERKRNMNAVSPLLGLPYFFKL